MLSANGEKKNETHQQKRICHFARQCCGCGTDCLGGTCLWHLLGVKHDYDEAGELTKTVEYDEDGKYVGEVKYSTDPDGSTVARA